MSPTNLEILSFLETCGAYGPQKLEVAILYSESMVRELKTTLGEWEKAVDDLRMMKQLKSKSIA